MPQIIPLLTLTLICMWYEEPPPRVTDHVCVLALMSCPFIITITLTNYMVYASASPKNIIPNAY